MNKFYVFLIVFVACVSTVNAQNYIINDETGTVIYGASGTTYNLYDEGDAAGNYTTLGEYGVVLAATGGGSINITAIGSLGIAAGDTLFIYEGWDRSGELLYQNPDILTATPIEVTGHAVYVFWKVTTGGNAGFGITWEILDIGMSATITDASCSAVDDGIVELFPSGGVPPYSYSWTGTGTGTRVRSDLAAGSYTVTISDSNTPTANEKTATFNVGVDADVAFTFDTVSASCAAISNGEITLSATGASGSYNYFINDGGGEVQDVDNDGYFSNLDGAVAYTMRVEDASVSACDYSEIINLADRTDVSFAFDTTTATCSSVSDGAIEITGVSGATGSYKYFIDAVEKPSGLFSNLSAGTYAIRVEDQNAAACNNLQNIDVDNLPALSFTNIKTDASCVSIHNGSVTVTPSGGSGTYLYYINGVSNASNVFADLAGSPTGITYSIEIRDNNNSVCSYSENITIYSNLDVNIVYDSTNVSCFGESDASVSITAFGGSGAFNYSLDSSSWVGTNVFAGLSASTTVIYVQDAAAVTCVVTDTVDLGSLSALVATFDSVSAICPASADGQISATVTGGSGAYNYSLTQGGLPVASNTTGVFDGLSGSETGIVYDLEIVDQLNSNCLLTEDIIIESNAAISFDTTIVDATCAAVSDGQITVSNVQGGSGTFNYYKNGVINAGNSNVFTALDGNVAYSIKVEDVVNSVCAATKSCFVDDSANITFSFDSVSATCSAANDGSITLTNVAGGNGLYTYYINTVVNGDENFTNLYPANHIIRVEDAAESRCNKIQTISLETIAPLLFSYSKTDAGCISSNNGSITITVTGGSGAYSYYIDGNPNASNVFTDLAGSPSGIAYSIEVRDDNNSICTYSEDIIIYSNSDVSFVYDSTNATCTGESDASISITASGGSGAFNYSLDSLSWVGTNVFSGLPAVITLVYVHDATDAECVVTDTVQLGNLPTIVATYDSVFAVCQASVDGQITATVTGGSGAYNFSLSQGGSPVASNTTGIFAGLTGSETGIVYDLEIVDQLNSNCLLTEDIIIESNAAISFDTTIVDATCAAVSNGQITISNVQGGSGSYNYYKNGDINAGNSNLFSALDGNLSYTIKVEDVTASACATTKSCFVDDSANITFSFDTTYASCSSANDGSITLSNVAGGNGVYTYYINATINADENFINLYPANYTIRVEDAAESRCNKTEIITVDTITPISFTYTKTDASCTAVNDGTIIVVASGGSGSYEYYYDAGSGETLDADGVFENLDGSADYSIIVKDANATVCEQSAVVTINDKPSVDFTYNVTKASCDGLADGTITVVASGGNDSYNYFIDAVPNAGNVFVVNESAAGYDIEVQDAIASGCSVIKSITVDKLPAISATVSWTNVSCDEGADGQVVVSATGGNGNYEYAFNSSLWQAGNVFSGLPYSADLDTVYVRNADASSCMDSVTNVNITQPDTITLTTAITDNVCNGGTNGAINLTVSGGTAPYLYVWSNAAETQDLTGVAASAYDVEVTDSKGCVVGLTGLSVGEPSAVTATINPVDVTHVAIYGESTGEATVTPGGGTGAGTYSYSWNTYPEQTTVTAINLPARNYIVTVADGNLCSATATVTINQPLTPLSAGQIQVNGNDYDSICKGFVPDRFTQSAVASGGTPPYTFYWEHSTNLSAWSVYASGLDSSYQSSTALNENTFIRRRITDAAGDLAYSDTLRIYLVDTAYVSLSGINSNYCESDGLINFEAFPKPVSGTLGEFTSTAAISDGGDGTASLNLLDHSGDYTITYTYTNYYSCVSHVSKTITVFDTVGLAMNINSTYGLVDAPDSIEVRPDPATGTALLSGPGINSYTYYFDPQLAGTEHTHTITYSFTDINGCSNSISQNVQVLQSGGDIKGWDGTLLTSRCIDADTLTVVAYPDSVPDASVSFTCSAAGCLTDLGNGRALLDLSAYVPDADPDPDTIVLTYSYLKNSLTYNVVKNIAIIDVGTIGIASLLSGYCVDHLPIDLSVDATTPSGSFSGDGYVPGVGMGQFNPVLVGVSTANYLVYTTNTYEGCFKKDSISVDVYALPVINTLTYKKIFNIEESDFLLTADMGASFGTAEFFGDGVIESGGVYKYRPADALAGDHPITYRFTDNNGCVVDSVGTIKVINNDQQIVVPDGDKIYCYSQTPDTLTVTPGEFSVVGTFYGDGLVDCGDDSVRFEPASAGSGNHTILYSYRVDYGPEPYDTARFTIQTQIEVDSLPEISIDNLNAAYCDGDASVVLTGSPRASFPDGAFHGVGITNNTSNATATFDPADSVGSFEIKYVYTDVNQCTDSISQTVVVNALPQILTVDNKTLYNIGEVHDTLRAAPVGGNFSGSGILSDSIFSPSGAGVGLHSVTYEYTDGNNCVNDSVFSVQVEAVTGFITTNDADDVYCYTQGVDTIVGHPGGYIGAIGRFWGAGITDLGNDSAIFDPIAAHSGIHTIYYSYTVQSSADPEDTALFVVSRVLEVDSVGDVNFGTLAGSYCIGDNTVRLTGSPRANYPYGKFVGSGIYNNINDANFYPDSAGVGTFDVKYIYTTLNGCQDSAIQSVTVHELPVISLMDVRSLYNLDEPRDTLSALPAPGTFIGPGISSDSIFTPSVAGVDDHTIQYVYSDQYGCTVDSVMSVSVREAGGSIFVPDPDKVYCYAQGIDTLVGYPDVAGVIGEFSGFGITNRNDNTALFNPAIAGSGDHQIFFKYVVENPSDPLDTALFIVTTTIKVDSVGEVDFGTLATSYCIDANTVRLTGSPRANYPNGEFVGNGVFNNINDANFYPDSAGAGTFDVKYIYTTSYGCQDSAIKTVTVHDLPVITSLDVRTLYNIDDVRDTLAANPGPGVFFGAGISSDSIFTPSVAGVDDHTIRYQYVDEFGCLSDSVMTVAVRQAEAAVTVPDADQVYCYTQGVDILSATPERSGVVGLFYGDGITDLADNTAEFNPVAAGSGNHEIFFTYVIQNSADPSDTARFEVSTIITVDSVGSVDFGILDASYCIDENSVTLTGSPRANYPNGEFSGNGIINNINDAVFNPSDAGAGTFEVKYIYTSIYGCQDSAIKQVTVHDLPQITQIDARALYNLDEERDTLQAIPQGGIFTGAGILSDSIFSPVAAGVGEFAITYDYIDQYGCSNNTGFNIKVESSDGEIIVPDADRVYCYSEPTDTITATTDTFDVTGYFEGAGITNIGNNAALFNPQLAGSGEHIVQFTYTVYNESDPLDSAVFTVATSIGVDSIGELDFGVLATDYCIDEAAVNLIGSPRASFPHGEFSGAGVDNNIDNADFTPALAGSGLHEIQYKYTTLHACSDSVIKQVTVHQLPDIISVDARQLYNLEEERDTLQGIPSYGLFAGSGILSDSIFSPVAAGVGTHQIRYTIEDNFTCVNDTVFNIEVQSALGAITIPDADKVYCYTQSTDTLVGIANNDTIIGTFSGDGITNIGDNRALFNPAIAGAGSHDILFSYTGEYGIAEFEVSETILVDSIGELAFDIDQTLYCEDADQFKVLVINTRIDGTHEFSGITGDGALTSQGKAAFIYPQNIEPADYTVVYTYTTQYGCRDSISEIFTIAALPQVSFNMDTLHNYSGQSQLLSGIPEGGVFSGSGVVYDNSSTTYVFYPNISGTGEFGINYEYTDANACVNDTTIYITVQQADAQIVGFENYYCFYDEVDTLVASSVNGMRGGIITGSGVVEFSPVKQDSVLFYPNIAGGGSHIVTYTYYSEDSTEFEISETINVDDFREVTISGFTRHEYCNDADVVVLSAYPQGGVYTGSGIDENEFSPSLASIGDNIIEYTHTVVFTENFGNDTIKECITRGFDTVVVHAIPPVAFAGLNPEKEYCSNESAVFLFESPIGGQYSANVYVENDSARIVPENMNVGTNYISYQYTDDNGCSNIFIDTVVIRQIPSLRILGLSAEYCEQSGNDTINGEIIGLPDVESGWFIGEGIIDADTTDGIAVFNADSVESVGSYALQYHYTDEYGCEGMATANVVVNGLPVVDVNGFNPTYCQGDETVELIGVPGGDGGIYTIDDVSGSSLNQFSLSEAGVHYVSYQFTNSRGCTDFDEDSIIVYPAPSMHFGILDECIIDSISFFDRTISMDTIVSWEWSFGDISNPATNSSFEQNPKHMYYSEGNKTIVLSVTTGSNCTYYKDSIVTLGKGPDADFSWSNECHGSGSVVFDNTTVGTGIDNYTWIFDDGDSAYVRNPQHRYGDVREYDVTLIVSTENDCNDIVTKTVSIRPVIDVYPYDEDFEQGKGSWVARANDSLNTWEFGTPAGSYLNEAFSGENAWCTNLDGEFETNEHSWVDGPCFDFSGLERPMIKINYQSYTDEGFDGAVLQASGDNGQTWQRIGTLDDGINWYNAGGIVGNPGMQALEQSGWSGNLTDKWYEGRHDLDDYAGMQNVRFRVAFGADASSNKEGFSFDDIWIGERSRNVLVEQFTNSSSSACAQVMPLFNEFVNANSLDVIDLQYHVNFGGDDEMFSHNPMTSSARALYYGVSDVPHLIMDGNKYDNNTFAWVNDPMQLKLRSLHDPLFDIELSADKHQSSVDVSARIIALQDIDNDELSVQVAVVENQITAIRGANGENSFESVVKALLPDAGGNSVDQQMSAGDTKDINLSWNYQNVYDPDQIAVVVFVQNEITKEVYQAVSLNSASTHSVAIEDAVVSDLSLNVYPNPTSGIATIVLPQDITANAVIEIKNKMGQLIETISLEGNDELQLQSQNYAPGVYLIQLTDVDGRSEMIKLVVIR